jgi:hypothetical protein
MKRIKQAIAYLHQALRRIVKEEKENLAIFYR